MSVLQLGQDGAGVTDPTKRMLTQVWNSESVRLRSSTIPEILAAAMAFLQTQLERAVQL